MKRYGSTSAVILLTAAAWLAAAALATATLPIQKKAKEKGFPAQSCLYCHNEKLPKKDAVSHNDRGRWLRAQKEKRKAKEVDVAWLKEYVEKR